jgi:hypothetical protein
MSLDRRQFKALYKPSGASPALVDVPPLRFLQIDGAGDVESESFREAAAALYGLAYPVKFAAKKQLRFAYEVPPLEAVHRPAGDLGDIDSGDGAPRSWRLMLMVPDEISGEFIEQVREKVAGKKNPPRLADIRLQTFSEGTCVQILHVGPYATELPAIERLLAFAEERGYDVTGDHHEIYLGDPNRAAAEKLKTVLRYGVRKRRG